MTVINQNSGYGQAQMSGIPYTTGKVFVVANTVNKDRMQDLYRDDEDGTVRLHTTITSALSACVTDRGDVIVLAPDFTTAPTAAELESAATKGVTFSSIGQDETVARSTATLPQTDVDALFTVTGKVKVTDIVGEVTTVIQTQANNTKLIANPTVGADVDICAVLDISADAVGTMYHITGTFTDALIATTSGAFTSQASSVIVAAGTIDLSCAASNTGSVKWTINYEPIDPGAKIIAA